MDQFQFRQEAFRFGDGGFHGGNQHVDIAFDGGQFLRIYGWTEGKMLADSAAPG
jgi:hypothetical protein